MKVYDAKRIHMVGIKGQGMTALAEILQRRGISISGSDVSEVFSTDAVLQELGVDVRAFDPGNIGGDIEMVIYSSAYKPDHPEIASAHGIPCLSYAQALAEIFNASKGILVTGTHGKTTTTAMIGMILEAAGMDPTVLVGSTVIAWGRNARVGNSELMVAEGDEYQGKFLLLRPHILVITNIEYDHPDYFKTAGEYREAFRTLVHSMSSDGVVIARGDLQEMLGPMPCRVGWFDVEGERMGRHWELNRMAATLVADVLGVPHDIAERSLREFRGTVRRTEFYTPADAPTVVIDDFAHHPTEIATTLADIRERYPWRFITAIFHPHTYSRTASLLNEFGDAFSAANEVIVLPVYSSARERPEDFPPDLQGQLVARVARFIKDKNPQYLKGIVSAQSLEEATGYCKNLAPYKEGRVVITLGAGDVWQVAKELTK